MNADGSGVVRLTNTPLGTTWSPDGRRIAFYSRRDGNREIYAMNADGSGLARLTNNSAWDDRYPSWSPDGRRIAFQSDRDGNDEIYAMNADGSGVARLTNNSADDWHPSWGPPPPPARGGGIGCGLPASDVSAGAAAANALFLLGPLGLTAALKIRRRRLPKG